MKLAGAIAFTQIMHYYLKCRANGGPISMNAIKFGSGLAAAGAICLLATSCGQQTPKEDAYNTPKPIYEVPAEQLAAERNFGAIPAAAKSAAASSSSAGFGFSSSKSGSKKKLDDGFSLGKGKKISLGFDGGKDDFKIGKKDFGKDSMSLKFADNTTAKPATATDATATKPATASKPVTVVTEASAKALTAKASADSASKNATAKPIGNAPPAGGLISETVKSADSLANYATGVTALTIKKNVENKVKKIQGNHNEELEKALDETN